MPVGRRDWTPSIPDDSMEGTATYRSQDLILHDSDGCFHNLRQSLQGKLRWLLVGGLFLSTLLVVVFVVLPLAPQTTKEKSPHSESLLSAKPAPRDAPEATDTSGRAGSEVAVASSQNIEHIDHITFRQPNDRHLLNGKRKIKGKMRAVSTENSALQDVEEEAEHRSRLVVLLSPPKHNKTSEIDDFFDNSVEIQDPFSEESFRSVEVLNDISIEVVDNVSSQEADDFTIIHFRNLTKDSSNISERVSGRRSNPQGSRKLARQFSSNSESRLKSKSSSMVPKSNSMNQRQFRERPQRNRENSPNMGRATRRSKSHNARKKLSSSRASELQNPSRVRVSRRKIEAIPEKIAAPITTSGSDSSATSVAHMSVKLMHLDSKDIAAFMSHFASSKMSNLSEPTSHASLSMMKQELKYADRPNSPQRPQGGMKNFVTQELSPPVASTASRHTMSTNDAPKSDNEISPTSTNNLQPSPPILLVGEDFSDGDVSDTGLPTNGNDPSSYTRLRGMMNDMRNQALPGNTATGYVVTSSGGEMCLQGDSNCNPQSPIFVGPHALDDGGDKVPPNPTEDSYYTLTARVPKGFLNVGFVRKNKNSETVQPINLEPDEKNFNSEPSHDERTQDIYEPPSTQNVVSQRVPSKEVQIDTPRDRPREQFFKIQRHRPESNLKSNTNFFGGQTEQPIVSPYEMHAGTPNEFPSGVNHGRPESVNFASYNQHPAIHDSHNKHFVEIKHDMPDLPLNVQKGRPTSYTSNNQPEKPRIEAFLPENARPMGFTVESGQGSPKAYSIEIHQEFIHQPLPPKPIHRNPSGHISNERFHGSGVDEFDIPLRNVISKTHTDRGGPKTNFVRLNSRIPNTGYLPPVKTRSRQNVLSLNRGRPNHLPAAHSSYRGSQTASHTVEKPLQQQEIYSHRRTRKFINSEDRTKSFSNSREVSPRFYKPVATIFSPLDDDDFPSFPSRAFARHPSPSLLAYQSRIDRIILDSNSDQVPDDDIDEQDSSIMTVGRKTNRARNSATVYPNELKKVPEQELQKKNGHITAKDKHVRNETAIFQLEEFVPLNENDFSEIIQKYENRSWPTYDFSFHFHRDLALNSERKKRRLGKVEQDQRITSEERKSSTVNYEGFRRSVNSKSLNGETIGLPSSDESIIKTRLLLSTVDANSNSRQRRKSKAFTDFHQL